MIRRGVRLRRTRNLLVYWQNGALQISNFGSGHTVRGRPITCELLDFFDDWKTPKQASDHFSSYPRESVKFALSQLLKHGLLVRSNSPAADFDQKLAEQWSSWLPEGSFHFITKDAHYVKRTRSVAEWKALLPKGRRPAIFKSLPNAKKISLPKMGLPDSEFAQVLLKRKTHRKFSARKLSLETVSQLLSLVWGVRGYLYSPVFGRLIHKTSPSGGARHPGEVYLMALRVKGLRRGLYHYHPKRHALEMITAGATPQKAKLYCGHQSYTRSAAALFLMTAVFARTMWKYPKGRAYRVVLLDAGHLGQTFCLVATWLGLAPFCTAALSDKAIEKDLKIDGVSESVLYVAGVGMRRRVRPDL
ncbi:MAG TPA: SagB/ThcOx family dehydrogenase [Chthoniobacterales bacterium]|nr:SagB/ThcOx family dehydrogenase [Chthoniobacterales bacterium]